MTRRQKPETIAAQAGGTIDAATGALVPPIHIATTFERDPDNAYSRGYLYARSDNATVRQVEGVLDSLEGGTGSLLFSSGMAAAVTAFMALQRPAHVVAPNIMYWGLKAWLQSEAPSYGIATTFVDGASVDSIAEAIAAKPTALVWLETPANPTWIVTDIAKVADLAHAKGALVAVDSTVASPVLTRPIEHGADVVMHAATKYLNGHSDVVAGSLTFARTGGLAERAMLLRRSQGAILGPFEAAMLMRGLRTLYVRVAHQSQAALKIAHALEASPFVERVLYPGLPRSQGFEITQRQMTGGFGGMLSVQVKGGEAAAICAAANVKVWKRATSLGGVESLIEHRASIEGPTSLCPTNLLRLSVGLEHVDDLIGDLNEALAASS